MPANSGYHGTLKMRIGVARVGIPHSVGTIDGYLPDKSNPGNAFGVNSSHVVDWEGSRSERPKTHSTQCGEGRKSCYSRPGNEADKHRAVPG